jgi:predicted 2-oxoglutarate/Fe(II)-dependent dioxygenase YbiX
MAEQKPRVRAHEAALEIEVGLTAVHGAAQALAEVEGFEAEVARLMVVYETLLRLWAEVEARTGG